MKKDTLSNLGTYSAATLIVLLVGLLDYLTGYELDFFVFYFMPIALVAWSSGLAGACVFSLFSALTYLTADWYALHPYSTTLLIYSNTLIELTSFLVVAFTVAKIRALLIEERKISDDLREAFSEIKTLSGLIPICASCKKIRDDAGYWQQVEVYIAKHSEARFTHGLCEDCAAAMLAEAGIEEKKAQ
jgi:K+-sensing histidine kinase KdpD